MDMESRWGVGRSFRFRLPLPRPLFRVGNLGGGHVVRDLIMILCCEVPPLVVGRVGGCEVVPHVGKHIILGHAVSEFIQPAKVVLRTRVPLGSSLSYHCCAMAKSREHLS